MPQGESYQERYVRYYNDKTREQFISENLTTYNGAEGKEGPFMLFPRQEEFLKSLATNTNTVAIKPRQAGITTVSTAWAVGQCVFCDPDKPETILCVCNKLTTATEILKKVENFLGQVPRWMWGAEYYSPNPKDPKNTKSIFKQRNQKYIELFNGCKVYVRSASKDAGRGVSAVSILIMDEAAFIENGNEVYAAARATMSSNFDAKTIMVSTPNGKDPLYYNTYKQASSKTNNFNAVEFRWYQDPRYNRELQWYRPKGDSGEMEWDDDPIIDKKGNIIYDEERWRRLDREGWKPTSPWYREMCKSLNNDKRLIAQELDVSFLGSSDTVVDADIIEYHQNNNVIAITQDWPLRDPLCKDTWIWVDPIPGHRYVCCVDPSTGSSDDPSALEILDIDAVDEHNKPYTAQVLEYNGLITGDELGELTYRYATAYNNALVVIESIGGYGDAPNLVLMRHGYPNLYYDDPGLKNYTAKNTFSKYTSGSTDNKLPGFRSSSLRSQMISFFVEKLKENTFRIRSQRVINELDTWIFKNGRPDHMKGFHDDTLTCLAMGLFVTDFYYLRMESGKEMSAAMAVSWRCSSSTTHTDNSQPRKPVNIPLPFYTQKTLKKTKTVNSVDQMLMLQGFGGRF